MTNKRVKSSFYVILVFFHKENVLLGGYVNFFLIGGYSQKELYIRWFPTNFLNNNNNKYKVNLNKNNSNNKNTY